jgi:hypothetical protein
VGKQEVSKPVMVAVIAAAVIVIGLIGWYFMRAQDPTNIPRPTDSPQTAGPSATAPGGYRPLDRAAPATQPPAGPGAYRPPGAPAGR